MKITHVITRMVAGGAQKNTLACCLEQARRGHQVTLVSGIETSAEGSLLEACRTSSCFRFLEVASLVREINPLRDLRTLVSLIKELKQNPPDLLHTHTSKAGLIGRVAARICSIPVVHTPHGHVFHSYFSKPKELLFKFLETLLSRTCTDAMVMLTVGELRDHLQDRIAPASQLYVIPSGVPLARFRSVGISAELGVNPVIGYVGRLADIKGPLDLIRAFACLPRNCSLLMVGDGPQRAEVERLVAELKLTSRVEITGWKEDTLPYLARMDILAVPSHNEGMGRVVVEAMAFGLPVVATRIGGLPDLVSHGHNGLLVDRRQPSQLADAIAAIIRLDDRGRGMGAAGKKTAEEFSEELMFSRLEGLYQKVTTFKGR